MAVTIQFTGNLDKTQPADVQPGGILNIGTNGAPILPIGLGGVVYYGIALAPVSYGPGQALSQQGDITAVFDAACPQLANHGRPLLVGGVSIGTAQSSGIATYAWQSFPRLYPACSVSKGVTDSMGQFRQIMIQFYQTNDIGDAAPPVNPNPPHQVAYAWYAFETTGGQQPNNSNLIGGTGVVEGNVSNTCPYDRGNAGFVYSGDFLYFNGDGSSASEGGVGNQASICANQAKPCLYLPPSGLGVLQVQLNFGTAGLEGFGLRDGITGDAAPSLVN